MWGGGWLTVRVEGSGASSMTAKPSGVLSRTVRSAKTRLTTPAPVNGYQQRSTSSGVPSRVAGGADSCVVD